VDGGGEADPSEAELAEALLAVLAGVGLRRRLSGGLTVRELWQRLPAELQSAGGARIGVAAEQAALDMLRQTLLGLEQEGRVRRRRARHRFFLNTKGSRLFEVDLFRLA